MDERLGSVEKHRLIDNKLYYQRSQYISDILGFDTIFESAFFSSKEREQESKINLCVSKKKVFDVISKAKISIFWSQTM